MKTLTWRIGGAQGSGIDRGALLLARACAKYGLHVLSRREYHSNIIGRHSYSDMRAGHQPVYGPSAVPNLLVCLDAEAICRHVNVVAPGGCIIYAADDASQELSKLKYLDDGMKNRLHDQLQQAGQPASVAGLLAGDSARQLIKIGIPYSEMLKRMCDENDLSISNAKRSQNILAVAVSAALLGLPQEFLTSELDSIFPGQPAVVMLNRQAIKIAWEYVQALDVALEQKFESPADAGQGRLWVNGAQSVALGKLAAGMGMQTYYPISPATDESLYLESHADLTLENDNQSGPVIFQTEDELAAITMACGGALTGARVATSTSGPGFSLMAEGLGWAGMNEVPVVISLFQRGGPSTGMPTRTEQGDLLPAIHAGHGEFARIVIASGDIEECFYDSFQAFNYAERYQLPVIHLLDKHLASSAQALDPFATEYLEVDRGARIDSSDNDHDRQQRFRLTESGISPRPVLGEPGQVCWTTGVEHSEWGLVSEDPVMRTSMVEKRARKLASAAEEIPLTDKLVCYGDREAAITVVSWGSNKGVLLEAMQNLAQQSMPIHIVMIRLLWPFPALELERLVKQAGTLVVVECNQSGQLNQLLAGKLGRSADHLVVKYNGRPHTLEELSESLREIHAGRARHTIVHQNDYE
jgi:2-oxoglutarate ferredoxin oxidoreductase subunit alpha